MRVAVLGATGLVGRAMLRLLADCDWLESDPKLLVSARSAGTVLTFRGRDLPCLEVAQDSFNDVDVALFSAGGAASRLWGPVAIAAGAWVVDNSSAFRTDADKRLIVPEINGDLVPQVNRDRASDSVGEIIANPNCSTIQVAMAVASLEAAFGLTDVHVTTLQAVSGGGRDAVEELIRQNSLAAADLAPDLVSDSFPRSIAGNVIPAIGSALPCGGFEEEVKVERELRKILRRPNGLAVTCTATRVPVINGHSAAVRVVCGRPITPADAVKVLQAWPGLSVAADPHDYLTPRQIDGRCDVAVGRIRQDPNNPHALLMWVVADNLLKGAAWNAVQIGALLAQGDMP